MARDRFRPSPDSYVRVEFGIFMREAGDPSVKLMRSILARWNDLNRDVDIVKAVREKRITNILAVAIEMEVERVHVEAAINKTAALVLPHAVFDSNEEKRPGTELVLSPAASPSAPEQIPLQRAMIEVVREKVESIHAGQNALTAEVRGIRKNLPEQRRALSAKTQEIHIRATWARRNGLCPCRQEAPVCSSFGRLDSARYDHRYSALRTASPKLGWCAVNATGTCWIPITRPGRAQNSRLTSKPSGLFFRRADVFGADSVTGGVEAFKVCQWVFESRAAHKAWIQPG